MIFVILPKYILAISTIFDGMMIAKVKWMIRYRRLLIIIAFFFCSAATSAQSGTDTLISKADSSVLNIKDSGKTTIDTINVDTVKMAIQSKVKSFQSTINDLLITNKFINVKDAPVYMIADKKNFTGKEFLFYSLCVVVLILGIFKTFYRSYFNNLFRVFFNTSLRQSQLTDQLLQAKLPSFILNIFFTITAGIFIWLLFTNAAAVSTHSETLISRQLLLPFCIVAIGTLYFLKYCILKFIGWLSGMQQNVDSYIFIIFLVNKISGIVLVPFIIILAFALPGWTHLITTVSLFITALFFLSRYLKTYGVLEYNFPMNAFHFLIYISATEIIPLLLIYKITIDYLL